MSRKTILTVIAFAAMLLAGGCFEKVPFTVTNELEFYDIHVVYISRSSDNVWGTNRLPGTDVLAPGKTAEVIVSPGTYDIQVTDEDGDTYTLNDVRIGPDGFDWTVTIDQIDAAAAPQPMNTGSCPVIIKNDLGSWDITGVWISDTYTDDWGDNHIQGEILNPGDSYTAYISQGTYDIYLEDEDGDTYTKWSVVVGELGYTWNVTLSDIDSSGG